MWAILKLGASGKMSGQTGDVIVDSRQAPALDAARDTETTPLLNGQLKATAGDAEGQQHNGALEDQEQTVLADDVTGPRLWLILSSAYVGVFLGAIDSTIIATLSAPISSEFKSLSLLSWLATAYLIANAACQPISGRLTDIFGRGPGLVFSNVFFAAGNLICGLAQTDIVMIIGRVVAGIGGGGLMSISTFLASDLVPLRKRGIIQGIGNICYGSGAMLGGVFGGFVNDNSSRGWRLAFLIQVPVIVVSGLLVFFLVKVPPKASNKSYISRIDFVGAFLTMAFLVVLLLGLNAGGNLVAWTDPLVLTTLPLAFVLLVGFVLWESRAALPIIPVRLLVNRTVLTACITNLVCTMGSYQLSLSPLQYLCTSPLAAFEHDVLCFATWSISGSVAKLRAPRETSHSACEISASSAMRYQSANIVLSKHDVDILHTTISPSLGLFTYAVRLQNILRLPRCVDQLYRLRFHHEEDWPVPGSRHMCAAVICGWQRHVLVPGRRQPELGALSRLRAHGRRVRWHAHSDTPSLHRRSRSLPAGGYHICNVRVQVRGSHARCYNCIHCVPEYPQGAALGPVRSAAWGS